MTNTRPNILFLFTDQQSASMMSCAGNAYLKTPAMDHLAVSGVRFDRAYCTNPVCVPSRFSLMTGRMPSEIGLFKNSSLDIDPIPEEIQKQGLGWKLREAGYQPTYAGKVHLPKKLEPSAFGFETIESDQRDKLAETCANWLRARPQEPFCLVASFINPHDICFMAIRESLASEAERYVTNNNPVACETLDRALRMPAGVDEETFFAEHCPPLPENFEPQENEPSEVTRLLDDWPHRSRIRKKWDARRWRELRWAYARLTEFVDRQIGQVLDALEESGQEENTLVVFTSDHGDMNAAHRLSHKSMLYEEDCRIPFIIRPPGGRQGGGAISQVLTSNGLDILPTLCDYAGADIPEGLPGQSLRSVVEDPEGTLDRPFVPIENQSGRAIVSRQFKYVRYETGEHAEQLYDLQNDPGEMRNAAEDTENLETLRMMRRVFDGHYDV